MDLKKKSGKPIVALSGKKHKCIMYNSKGYRPLKPMWRFSEGSWFPSLRLLIINTLIPTFKNVYNIRVGKNPSIMYSIHSQTILTMAHLSRTRDPT